MILVGPSGCGKSTLLRMLAFKPAGLKTAHVSERKAQAVSSEPEARAPESVAAAPARPVAPPKPEPAPKPAPAPMPSGVQAVGVSSGLPPIERAPMPEELPPWGEPDAG